MEIYGNLWKSMEIYGNLWKSMEIYGNLWQVYRDFEVLYIPQSAGFQKATVSPPHSIQHLLHMMPAHVMRSLELEKCSENHSDIWK